MKSILNNSTDCENRSPIKAVRDKLKSDAQRVKCSSVWRSALKRVGSGVEGSPAVAVDAVDAVSSAERSRHHVVQVRAGAVDLRARVRAVIQILPAQARGRGVGQVHVRVFWLIDLWLVGEEDFGLGTEEKWRGRSLL